MPSRTIQELSEKIKNARIGKVEKDELVKLISSLKTELEGLSATNKEHAESIANFAEASAHEAVKKEQNPELREISIKGLTTSVEDFEALHPSLVKIVNRISVMLSNIGI
ncbi:MAG: hypothetical protein A2020_09575 [Lentisphaerae bacterium GWF2_45_14]|nr:MAG: hypothetical protein A2020_09575 [Lentisphaerae bacterium GWF2_45_14]